jgi:hypothetical protein
MAESGTPRVLKDFSYSATRETQLIRTGASCLSCAAETFHRGVISRSIQTMPSSAIGARRSLGKVQCIIDTSGSARVRSCLTLARWAQGRSSAPVTETPDFLRDVEGIISCDVEVARYFLSG